MMVLSSKSLGVYTRATPCSIRRLPSLSGMMPPTTTGTLPMPASLSAREHLGHQLEVAAAEDGEADHVRALLERAGHDLLGRHTDALVDDLEADVARLEGDLLGSVGVAVEAGLAHQQAGTAAQLLLERAQLLAQASHLVRRPSRCRDA